MTGERGAYAVLPLSLVSAGGHPAKSGEGSSVAGRLPGAARWEEPSHAEDIFVLGFLPAGKLGRTGIDGSFVPDDLGWELLTAGRFGISINFARVPLRDPDSGLVGFATRFEIGQAWYTCDGNDLRDLRLLPRLEHGGSLLWLNLGGRERDTLGFGWYARAGLLIRVWRGWGIDLHGDVHGWVGMDDDDFQLVGEAGVGVGVARSW